MITGATFSDCRKYRYKLWRVWREDCQLLCFLMLNPSTADENVNDATIKKCIKYAINNGYGGIIVINIFALRSTLPSGLLAVEDPVGPKNDETIKEIAENGVDIVCAWGKVFKKLEYRPLQLRTLLAKYELKCLKANKDGSPSHPLYLKDSLKPISWKFPEV